MEVLDRAEMLMDRLIAASGNGGADGNGRRSGSASPLSVYLSGLPDSERADREHDIRKRFGLCADCTALVIRDDARGCGHPEVAMLGTQPGVVRTCTHFEQAG